MKKNILQKLSLILIVLLLSDSCKNGVVPGREIAINDKYSAIIAEDFDNSKNSEVWICDNDNRIKVQTFIVLPKGNQLIKELLDNLVTNDQTAKADKKSLVETQSIKFGDFTGLYEEYDYNNNTNPTGFPVLTHYYYSVIENANDFILVKAFSLGLDLKEDFINSVKSITQKSEIAADTLNKNKSTNIEELKEDGYQIFLNDQFAIKCPCLLMQNSDFNERVKRQKDSKPTNGYVCADNENDFNKVAIININVSDLKDDYQLVEGAVDTYENTYFENYYSLLVETGIESKYSDFAGVKAIEYTFDQMGLPTKAIIFLKNKRSYLIQIGSRDQLDKKYLELKESFKTL